MFKNVGRKIKTLAKVFYWIIFVTYCLSAAGFLGYMIIQGCAIVDYNAAKGWMLIGAGVLGAAIMVGFAFLLAWLSTVLLYGFGELIDQTAEINSKLAPAKQDRPVPPPPMGMRPPMPPAQPVYQPEPQPVAPVAQEIGYCEKCRNQVPMDRITAVRTPDGAVHNVCLDCFMQMKLQ